MNEAVLERIAIALEAAIAISGVAPNWEYPLEEFPIDWPKLGITPHGPTEKPTALEWMGHRFELFESKAGYSYQRMVSASQSALLIRFFTPI
jgi:hypothetical protein